MFHEKVQLGLSFIHAQHVHLTPCGAGLIRFSVGKPDCGTKVIRKGSFSEVLLTSLEIVFNFECMNGRCTHTHALTIFTSDIHSKCLDLKLGFLFLAKYKIRFASFAKS